jgi:outer membrane autotransporter protein
MFGGFSRSDFRLVGGSASGESNDYHLGVYGGTRWDAFALRLGASYSWDGIITNRTIAFGDFTNQLRAVYNAGTTQAFVEAAYRMDDLWDVALEPFANLAYVNLGTNGFSETGGPAALIIKADRLENAVTTLGLRPSTTVTLDSFDVTLRGMMGWRHIFGAIEPNTTVAFAGGSDAFTVTGAPIARDVAALEAGFDVELFDNVRAGLTYGGQFSNRSTEQQARGTIRISF